MELNEIELIIRGHSRGHNRASIDSWLTHSTLCRFRDWVPRPESGEIRLLDIGHYQPTIAYYAALGWREVVGIAKEEGECNRGVSQAIVDGATAKTFVLDIETETIPQPSETVDVVLMMEIFEHFGLDPMHALTEVNRVLKPGGLLVFSTPNATTFANLWRLVNGKGPYGGLEFSGFSTNRHNRIYDCHELREIMAAGGFEVEICRSQGYHDGPTGLSLMILETALKLCDKWTRLKAGRQIERHAYIFIRARKRGPVVDRYPRVLYFDPEEWPDWFQAIRERRATSRTKWVNRA